jgi:drug/metabolite transporter (DMT)-like permease
VSSADPITLAILRWGFGFLFVLPVALLLRARWPRRADWPGVSALGLSFFGLFFVLYNVAIGYTTAARASLALSTLPLQTMVVGALLGIEPLTTRKCTGVALAMLGVFAALASGLAQAPPGAWRGELIMTGAVLCMAFYNVWSRPFIARLSALGFLTVGMGADAAALLLVGIVTGCLAALNSFGASEWIAGVYLGVAGGALAFILWVLALERATPTRVANTMTVNPVAAALLATVLLGEPITLNLIVGLTPCSPASGSRRPADARPANREIVSPRVKAATECFMATPSRCWCEHQAAARISLRQGTVRTDGRSGQCSPKRNTPKAAM